MSSLFSLPLVASLLASVTSQAMLVAAAVGAGVLAWVMWNALHSAPVAKYDPWENDRTFGPGDTSARRPSDAFGDSNFDAAQSPKDLSGLPDKVGAPGGHATGSPLLEPVGQEQGVSAEPGSSPRDWKSSPPEPSDEVRAMLKEIKDPETRRMLAESLKQIEGEQSR